MAKAPKELGELLEVAEDRATELLKEPKLELEAINAHLETLRRIRALVLSLTPE